MIEFDQFNILTSYHNWNWFFLCLTEKEDCSHDDETIFSKSGHDDHSRSEGRELLEP